jgi:Fe-S oxidoreductase
MLQIFVTCGQCTKNPQVVEMYIEVYKKSGNVQFIIH